VVTASREDRCSRTGVTAKQTTVAASSSDSFPYTEQVKLQSKITLMNPGKEKLTRQEQRKNLKKYFKTHFYFTV
jgi:hypothetical protein